MDYLVSGMGGLLVGALFYGLTYRLVFPKIAALANLGAVTLPDLWRVSPFLMVLLVVLVCAFLFYLLENGLSRNELE